jgi:hypothetical protein
VPNYPAAPLIAPFFESFPDLDGFRCTDSAGQIPIVPAPPGAHSPRLRSLAVFERRPSVRGVPSAMGRRPKTVTSAGMAPMRREGLLYPSIPAEVPKSSDLCHLLTHAAQQSVEWEVRDNPQQYERVTRHRRAGQLLCRLGRKLPVLVGLSDYILA